MIRAILTVAATFASVQSVKVARVAVVADYFTVRQSKQINNKQLIRYKLDDKVG